MHVISWEEYLYVGSGEWGVGSGECTPLAVTIGVFDGVHLGHQSLIQRICTVSSPDPRLSTSDPQPPSSLLPTPHSPLPTSPPLPTVITFKQNPLQVLKPKAFAGDIMTLEQKIGIFELLGVQLTVLIDFSAEFSKIKGRDFISLLLDSKPVQLIVLGRNFRCGQGLDTGVEEIQSLAEARGVNACIMPPLMDGDQPVSSSRIRQALAAGRIAEAERLLGRPIG